MLLSFPPAITLEWYPSRQGQEGSFLHLIHLQANPLCYPGEKEPPERQALAEGKEKGKRSLRLRLMERVQRPVGAPEPAEHRQGQRGWRLKSTQPVPEES